MRDAPASKLEHHVPKYFFDVFNGPSNAAGFGSDLPDADGTSFPDIYAAQAESIRYSAELLSDLGLAFWNEGVWRMEVFDEGRRLLFTLTFSVTEPLVEAPPIPPVETK